MIYSVIEWKELARITFKWTCIGKRTWKILSIHAMNVFWLIWVFRNTRSMEWRCFSCLQCYKETGFKIIYIRIQSLFLYKNLAIKCAIKSLLKRILRTIKWKLKWHHFGVGKTPFNTKVRVTFQAGAGFCRTILRLIIEKKQHFSRFSPTTAMVWNFSKAKDR